MNFFIYFFLSFILLSCSKKDDNLVDVQSYLKQGKSIKIFDQNNLNDSNISKISQISIDTLFENKDWTQSNGNIQNLNLPSNIYFSKKKISFSGKFQKIISYKDKIFIIGDNSELIILNSSLKKLNSIKIYKKKNYKNYKIKFDLVAYDNKIYISDNLGNITALNIESLKKIWSLKLGVPFRSNIKISNNKLYIINSNSKIYSIDAQKGKILWSIETASKDIKDEDSYQISIYENKLYFTNDYSEIFCLDLIDQNIKWSLVFSKSNFQKVPKIFKSSPIVIDNNGDIFVSTNYGTTYKIDSKIGYIKWSNQIFYLNRPVITKKYLIAIHNNRFFILNKSNGNIVFNKKISFERKNKDLFLKNILVSKKYIYFFTSNGQVGLLNIKKLDDIKIEKKLGTSSMYKDYILSNGELFVLTNNLIIKY